MFCCLAKLIPLLYHCWFEKNTQELEDFGFSESPQTEVGKKVILHLITNKDFGFNWGWNWTIELPVSSSRGTNNNHEAGL